MPDRPPFKTLFAVPLDCQGCTRSVTASLKKVDGVININCHLEEQLVEVEGTAAPSAIARALASIGKDAILRGSGQPNSAAVCILETHAPNLEDPVRGLVRLVQVAPGFTILDVSIRGLPSGLYHASIRQNGDISKGAVSAGPVWEEGIENPESRGKIGAIDVDDTGAGSIIVDGTIEIWELIGRSIVVSRDTSNFQQNDEATLVGVIARSAGAWENSKTVCSCSGKTVWEERAEQTSKGMI